MGKRITTGRVKSMDQEPDGPRAHGLTRTNAADVGWIVTLNVPLSPAATSDHFPSQLPVASISASPRVTPVLAAGSDVSCLRAMDCQCEFAATPWMTAVTGVPFSWWVLL